jgi:hypothetical protein
MFRIPLAIALVAAASPSVAADPSTLVEAAFGNTIISTYPDGRSGKLWLQPDGGYSALGPSADRSNGRWWLKDNRICLKQAHPFAFGYVYCTVLSQFETGASWVTKAVTGETLRITLASGRPDRATD